MSGLPPRQLGDERAVERLVRCRRSGSRRTSVLNRAKTIGPMNAGEQSATWKSGSSQSTNRNDTTCRTSVATITAIVDTPVKRASTTGRTRALKSARTMTAATIVHTPVAKIPGRIDDGQHQRDRAADERDDVRLEQCAAAGPPFPEHFDLEPVEARHPADEAHADSLSGCLSYAVAGVVVVGAGSLWLARRAMNAAGTVTSEHGDGDSDEPQCQRLGETARERAEQDPVVRVRHHVAGIALGRDQADDDVCPG